VINLDGGDITAAVPGNYTLLGGDHSHTFNLLSADFDTLMAGGTVTKNDLQGHGHSIEITC